MEKATNRQRVLLQHLNPSCALPQPHHSNISPSICSSGDGVHERNATFGDDVVIVAACRTAICKAKRGGFKDTLADDLLAPVLKALIDKTKINPSEVGDIVVGTVLAPGSARAMECRMAAFYAGFPGQFSQFTTCNHATSSYSRSVLLVNSYCNPLYRGQHDHVKAFGVFVSVFLTICDFAMGDATISGKWQCSIALPFVLPFFYSFCWGQTSPPSFCSASEHLPHSLGHKHGILVYATWSVHLPIMAYNAPAGISAGLESMTIDNIDRPRQTNPKVDSFAQARDCLLPMGITSENVAERYGVTRQEQDQAAVESHRRAAAATASGKFREEIIPVSTKIFDPKTGLEKYVTVSVDDGIRPSANLLDLAKLKPAFKKDGTSTAGNSSQVSDGAGAVLLMKRSLAMKKGLPILGVFRSFSVVGVDPAVMGIGPAVAIPAAVKSAGLNLEDIDLFEINEAFASQFVYCCKKLKLDREKVNVNGGAIALGHPLGATGARCVATLLHEMKRRGKGCRFGVISMCIGSGMGAAAVLERGDHADD
ncbi:hypothetical protein Cgig2_009315 [Carnegiea gigantea]|uniref:acetyl-CoA C-acyltransferase n=1 Tax=Carnegiea gigantea TaxID=171969 RepID=A0A9Q1JWE2_9CARY|nr:hypothetical protein Cgig2_009315 [Carnegiea gigantea]